MAPWPSRIRPAAAGRRPRSVSISVVLPAPFGPDQGDPLAALDGEVGARDQRPARHGDVEPLRLEHHPAAAGRRGEAEPERPLCRRPVDALDPRHRLQLALRLAGLRAVPEPVDEPLQVRQLALLALERVGLRRQPLGLQPPPVRVAALVEAALAALDLEHAGRDGLEEPAVVRDEDDARRRGRPGAPRATRSRSVSRWLVGSSSSSRSGSAASARVSDARVSSPPEKVTQRAVEVGRREPEAAGDRLEPRRQP